MRVLLCISLVAVEAELSLACQQQTCEREATDCRDLATFFAKGGCAEGCNNQKDLADLHKDPPKGLEWYSQCISSDGIMKPTVSAACENNSCDKEPDLKNGCIDWRALVDGGCASACNNKADLAAVHVIYKDMKDSEWISDCVTADGEFSCHTCNEDTPKSSCLDVETLRAPGGCLQDCTAAEVTALLNEDDAGLATCVFTDPTPAPTASEDSSAFGWCSSVVLWLSFLVV